MQHDALHLHPPAPAVDLCDFTGAALNRTQVWAVFGRNGKQEAIQATLAELLAGGRVQCEKQATSGAPHEVRSAIASKGKATAA